MSTIAELQSALDKTIAENKFLDGRVEALTLKVYDWRVRWQHARDKIAYLERQIDDLESDERSAVVKAEMAVEERQRSSREWHDAFDAMHKRAMDAEAILQDLKVDKP